MRYPAPLRPGDTIAVCAPSAGIAPHLHARLDNAIENVKKLGYPCIETASTHTRIRCVSGDAPTRAAEFMSVYEKPEVAAILPPWGGEFAMDLLPQLDFGRLRQLPPKWLCGYSDITTLSFALTVGCDMATIHGANLMNMGFAYIDPSDMAAFAAMSQTELVQQSPEYYGKHTSFTDISAVPYKLDQPSVWKSLDGKNQHAFSGRMIGGCLDVLNSLIGTRFADVNGFIDKYRVDGFIWTLESCEMASADIYRTLWHMRECGWFDACRGILIGRPDGYSDTTDFTLIDALRESFACLNVPVLYDVDIGHIPAQIQIVNGAVGEIVYKDGRAVVTQQYIP